MQRTPLKSKEVNLFGTPLKRQSPTKLKASPTKKQKQMAVNTDSFTIFQDPEDQHRDNASFCADLTPKLLDMGLYNDKENSGGYMGVSKRKASHPLDDLTITSYPGYLSTNTNMGGEPLGSLRPLGDMTQLREPWYTNKFSEGSNDKRLPVPSFVTPPKRDRVKSYKFVDSIDNASLDEIIRGTTDDLELLNGKVKRQLDFIHSDIIDKN